MSDMVETAIYSQWMHRDWFQKFCKINTLESTLVTTIDIKENKMVQEVNIQFVPGATCAYNVGKNTLDKKL